MLFVVCPIPATRDGLCVYDLEGVLGPTVVQFVEDHVSTLLAWDILVFFHRHPDAALDYEGLASRLGRKANEIAPEVQELCSGSILRCESSLITYDPTPEKREQVTAFVDSCHDRGRRLALIALVLHRLSRPSV